MNTILFVIKRPPAEDDVRGQQWWHIVNAVADVAKTSKEVEEMTLGCWLIRGESGMPFLGQAISQAHQYKFSYRMMILDEVTDWSCVRKVG